MSSSERSPKSRSGEPAATAASNSIGVERGVVGVESFHSIRMKCCSLGCADRAAATSGPYSRW